MRGKYTQAKARARDYFEVRVNKSESFLFFSTQKRSTKPLVLLLTKRRAERTQQTERKKNRIFLTKALDAFI